MLDHSLDKGPASMQGWSHEQFGRSLFFAMDVGRFQANRHFLLSAGLFQVTSLIKSVFVNVICFLCKSFD
jgi:hypothetical protein